MINFFNLFMYSNFFFLRRGPNQWRDVEKPVEILKQYCKTHHLPRPVWEYDEKTKSWKVTVSSQDYFTRTGKELKIIL